jgi:hypothetical protein
MMQRRCHPLRRRQLPQLLMLRLPVCLPSRRQLPMRRRRPLMLLLRRRSHHRQLLLLPRPSLRLRSPAAVPAAAQAPAAARVAVRVAAPAAARVAQGAQAGDDGALRAIPILYLTPLCADWHAIVILCSLGAARLSARLQLRRHCTWRRTVALRVLRVLPLDAYRCVASCTPAQLLRLARAD